MLVNATKKVIVLKWNGYEVTVKPGQKFHPVDIFNVTSREALSLEDRFVKKHPGILKIAAADQPYVWKEPETQAPSEPSETELEEGQQPKQDLIDPNVPRTLEQHSREELEAMASALKIKFTKKTSTAKLVESIRKKQDEEVLDE